MKRFVFFRSNNELPSSVVTHRRLGISNKTTVLIKVRLKGFYLDTNFKYVQLVTKLDPWLGEFISLHVVHLLFFSH